MLLSTKDFKEVCKTISNAVDKDAADLELRTRNNKLYLAVTNKEYYVCVSFETNTDEQLMATVDANLFLNLVSGLTVEEFELVVEGNVVKLKAGKSSYKLPIIYANEEILSIAPIVLSNKTVEMPISDDILKSILNVNSKEVQKTKTAINANDLQKLYYLTEEGCFSFSTGACLNNFALPQPVKVLLDDRIVKLFRLFNETVQFSFGYDAVDSSVQAKVVFETQNVYLSANIINDDIMLTKIKGPCEATKNYINESYKIKAVLPVNQLSEAISRLMLFTKNSINGTNMHYISLNVNISEDGFAMTDDNGNTEVVQIESGSYIEEPYDLKINVADIKLVLDSCKDEHITFNCGNGRSVVINRSNISHLIPESRRA